MQVGFISIHTLIFAQVLGLYLLITAIIMVSRRRLYQNLLTEVERPNLVIVAWGILGLIMGLILVTLHNIWVMAPQVLVTLVSWYILIKAVLWLSLPEKMLVFTHKMNTTGWFYVRCAVAAVIGVILLTKGYYFFLDQDYIPIKIER